MKLTRPLPISLFLSLAAAPAVAQPAIEEDAESIDARAEATTRFAEIRIASGERHAVLPVRSVAR